jgi:hypothetical protein
MGSGDVVSTFLTTALNEGDRRASRPGRFSSGEKFNSTNRRGDWVGQKTSLDVVEKRKNITLTGNR